MQRPKRGAFYDKNLPATDAGAAARKQAAPRLE